MYESCDQLAEQLASFQMNPLIVVNPISPPPIYHVFPTFGFPSVQPVPNFIPVHGQCFPGPIITNIDLQQVRFAVPPNSPPPVLYYPILTPLMSPIAETSITNGFGQAPFGPPPISPGFVSADQYIQYQNSPPAEEEMTFCAFCKKNGEREEVYYAHNLRDADNRLQCPILRKFTCPICGDTGDKAHTASYCPKKVEGAERSFTRMHSDRCAAGRKRYR